MAEQSINPTPQKETSLTSLTTTADPQASSTLFTVLPPEVRRMIFAEVWRHNWHHIDFQAEGNAFKQHIIKNKSGRYVHSPCVVADQNGRDLRSERLRAAQSIRRDVWIDRIESEWAVHWPCEELYKRPSGRQGPSFMSTLLTCKQMYIEAISTLYSTLTFVFTDTLTAPSFLSSYPPQTFRHLELALRLHPILPELYYPSQAERGRPPSFHAGHHLTPESNPWATLCHTLSSLPNLRTLRIWLDIRDLRKWSHRVLERRFLDGLWRVRTIGLGSFVLALPERADALSARAGPAESRRTGANTGDDWFHEERLEGAPFRVERGGRPDYWEAHLSKVRLATERTLLTIDAG